MQSSNYHLIIPNSIIYVDGKAVKQSVKIQYSKEQTKLFNDIKEGQGYLRYSNSIFNKTNGKLIGIYNYNPVQ